MGKKKPFINKRNASTYHVLHRSQRDVSQHLLNEGDTDAAGFILWPAPGNNPETDKLILSAGGGRKGGKDIGAGDDRMKEWREKLRSAGLLDDSGERERYLKEITGAGTFLSANGQIISSGIDPRQVSTTALDVDMLEVKDQVQNIPLKKALDDEIAAILYGDSDDINFDDYEELNDDFVLDAARDDPDDNDDGAFDYDAHIQKLMDKARLERQGRTRSLSEQPGHAWALRDQDFFGKAKALREGESEDDYDDSFADLNLDADSDMVVTAPGAVHKLNADEERALCEKFEETLLEYDSDEIGDNPEEEMEGQLPLEGDEQFESVLDDYLQEKEDEVFMQGQQPKPGEDRRRGGSGFSALVGKRMVAANQLDQAEGQDASEPADEVLARARERLADPPLQPPAEEILIDGQSYFSERVRNPFDCESILSTYSNLDNNPVTIPAVASRKRNKKRNKVKENDEEENIQQIQLSDKTGLPLGVLSSRHQEAEGNYDDDAFPGTVMSVNKGEARSKTETAEEKKARKAQVKRQRQMARIHKKVTREVFQEEFAKHSMQVGSDDVAGKPVFRYS